MVNPEQTSKEFPTTMIVSGTGILVSGMISLAGYAALEIQGYPAFEPPTIPLLGAVVLLSHAAVLYYSVRRARALGTTLWTLPLRRHLIRFGIGVAAGLAATGYCLSRGMFTAIAPVVLLSFGLAMLFASDRDARDLQSGGLLLLLLGAAAQLHQGHQMMIWGTGFGLIPLVVGVQRVRRQSAFPMQGRTE